MNKGFKSKQWKPRLKWKKGQEMKRPIKSMQLVAGKNEMWLEKNQYNFLVYIIVYKTRNKNKRMKIALDISRE